MTGVLEETNESYAVAKIAGIKMIESLNKQFNRNYICLMPCNLFGPNDNYDTQLTFFTSFGQENLFCKYKKREKNCKIMGNWQTFKGGFCG